jgi:hypothetical protein
MASNNSLKSNPIHVHPGFANYCNEYTPNVFVSNQTCHVYKHNNIFNTTVFRILIIIPTNAQLVLLYTVRVHVGEQYIIKLIVHLLV